MLLEQVDKARIEVAAAFGNDVIAGVLGGPDLLVVAVRCERVEHIHETDDST